MNFWAFYPKFDAYSQEDPQNTKRNTKFRENVSFSKMQEQLPKTNFLFFLFQMHRNNSNLIFLVYSNLTLLDTMMRKEFAINASLASN